MPIIAQSIVRFEWSSISDAFTDIMEVLFSNPWYLAGIFVLILAAGKMVFTNRQI